MKRTAASGDTIYLGLEAGGTRTVARAAELQSTRVIQRDFGPANLRLLSDRELLRHFRAIARAMPVPAAVCIGMAGARTDADKIRIKAAAALAWPRTPCYATNDLETALMAADIPASQKKRRDLGNTPRVLVLSGTGSCCFGRAAEGKSCKVGGWGHILGDKGSAYEIGLRALKAVVYYLDRDGQWSTLGQRLLRSLSLNEPNDLIGWVLNAGKDDVAGLAVEVFKAWENHDSIARDILAGAVESLARDAVACARQLRPRGGPVQFVFAGGVLLRQPRFAHRVRREVRRRWPNAVVTTLSRSGAEGAVDLARRHFPPDKLRSPHQPDRTKDRSWSRAQKRPSAVPEFGDVSIIAQSPTEQRNPRSMNLHRMSLADGIELMLSEDRRLLSALRLERKTIQRGVDLIVHSLRHGGRLFYIGAGTSGRLGVLDASECPPTFQTDPEMVQGIIAGGQRALWSAVEGAEDDRNAGAQAIQFRNVERKDTVVGIAASGRTPFVWGALEEAKQRGATTILLCFNPRLLIPRKKRPSLVIAPKIGPEILTGSTRLKAGTATKLILNMFTTLAMVRLGKVVSNLMIDVKASNVKLKDRATRIVRELTGVDYEAARAALLRRNWNIKDACAWLKRKVR